MKQLAVKDGFLRTASGYRFKYQPVPFERLKADSENIKDQFRGLTSTASPIMLSDILANMGFFTQIERMADAGSSVSGYQRLYC